MIYATKHLEEGTSLQALPFSLFVSSGKLDKVCSHFQNNPKCIHPPFLPHRPTNISPTKLYIVSSSESEPIPIIFHAYSITFTPKNLNSSAFPSYSISVCRTHAPLFLHTSINPPKVVHQMVKNGSANLTELGCFLLLGFSILIERNIDGMGVRREICH